MKIVCIGQNYRDHILEFGGTEPTEPVFFMKPDTALLRNNEDFYLPDFSSEIEYETEVVVKINRVTKSIEERFAHRCYDEIAVGLDFTARDLQARCKKMGRPWEISKAFDKSTPVPNQFISKESLGDLGALDFHLDIDGKCAQKGNTRDMIFSIDRVISYVSQFVTLKIGDLIFTGTPVGVGPLKEGNRLEAYLGDIKMLDFEIK